MKVSWSQTLVDPGSIAALFSVTQFYVYLLFTVYDYTFVCVDVRRIRGTVTLK